MTTAELWDKMSEKTGLDRDRCKLIWYSMVYGKVLEVSLRIGFDIEDIVDVRCAYSDIVYGRDDENLS